MTTEPTLDILPESICLMIRPNKGNKDFPFYVEKKHFNDIKPYLVLLKERFPSLRFSTNSNSNDEIIRTNFGSLENGVNEEIDDIFAVSELNDGLDYGDLAPGTRVFTDYPWDNLVELGDYFTVKNATIKNLSAVANLKSREFNKIFRVHSLPNNEAFVVLIKAPNKSSKQIVDKGHG